MPLRRVYEGHLELRYFYANDKYKSLTNPGRIWLECCRVITNHFFVHLFYFCSWLSFFYYTYLLLLETHFLSIYKLGLMYFD